MNDQQNDLAAQYLIRIQAEHSAALLAAPHYQEISDARKAVLLSLGGGTDVSDVAKTFPWVAEALALKPIRKPVAQQDAAEAMAAMAENYAQGTDGITLRRTGKFAVDPATGEKREIVTYLNPAGDIEAARLTRETGTQHIVDPNSGKVISLGGMDIEGMAKTAVAAAGTPTEFAPQIAPVTEGQLPGR